MTPIDRRDRSRPIGNLVIVLVVLLAVTLPIWGVFAGGMLSDGEYVAALAFFGLATAVVVVPVAIVAVFAAMVQQIARWMGRSLHLGLVAGLGAVLGIGLMVALTSNPVAGLLLGAIPGAAVALAMRRDGPDAGFGRDENDG